MQRRKRCHAEDAPSMYKGREEVKVMGRVGESVRGRRMTS